MVSKPTNITGWPNLVGVLAMSQDTSKHSDCSTTRPHSPQSAEPTPRGAPPADPVEPRRDPAPYSASGVQLKHAKWRADETLSLDSENYSGKD